jgi:iron complex transport system permease protein
MRLAIGLVIAGFLLVLAGAGLGASGWGGWAQLLGAGDAAMAQIVWEIRLPRSVGAWCAGALLGLSGAVAQSLFRNPLADPYLLGSASGAGLGVALVLAATGAGAGLLGAGQIVSPLSAGIAGRIGLTGAAFVGAVVAVSLTLALARGAADSMRLLLSGVVVGVVLAALTQIVLLASPQSLLAMQSFMLGTTGFLSWGAVGLMALTLLACALATAMLVRALDAFALGTDTARSMALPVGVLRAAAVGVMALATASAVAQVGLIAFVGLVAPHIVRVRLRAQGSVRAAQLCGLAALAGGALLCAADALARVMLAPQEVPVGVITAILGGGYLLWLLNKRESL